MISNKLKLNPDKTQQMTVGTQQRLLRLPKRMEVVMDDVVLKEDESGSEILLGCHIQSDLKWNQLEVKAFKKGM